MAAAATRPTQDALEQLRFQTRALSPEIWQPAVCRLVEKSGRSQRAYDLLSELLLSREPELRYRGVVGLQQAATLDSAALIEFVRDRWDEAETLADPVLMEALAQACQRLPVDRLAVFLDDVWAESNEAVRLSTVPLLWKVTTLRGAQALETALLDPSPVVRAHLALELVEKLNFAAAFEALTVLVQDREREVRGAVAMGLMSLASAALAGTAQFVHLRAILAKDHDAGVRGLLSEAILPKRAADSKASALALASELDTRPQDSLKKLSPWLRRAGSWHRLKAVAEFSCHPEVVFTARALAALCDETAPIGERLLRCVGSLAALAEPPASTLGLILQELKGLARLCLTIVEFEHFQDLAEWVEGQEKLVWAPNSMLACSGLFEAIRIVKLGGDVRDALELIQELHRQSATGPLPERELIEPALAHLSALMQESTRLPEAIRNDR